MTANGPPFQNHPLSPLEVGDDLDRIHFQSTSDIKELDHIQPPFAALELRHERLRTPELIGQCDLRQAGATTRVRQELAEMLMFPTERRLRHRGSLLSQYRISQNGLILACDRFAFHGDRIE